MNAANDVAPAHAPSKLPVLLIKQHEQQSVDGGVIDTPTPPQSLTEALLAPLTEQLKLPLQAFPHPDNVTVPAPIAVKENPEPYRQQPDVDSVIVVVVHGIEQDAMSIACANTLSLLPSSLNIYSLLLNIYDGYSKSGKSTSKFGALNAGPVVGGVTVQSHPSGNVLLELVPHKYT